MTIAITLTNAINIVPTATATFIPFIAPLARASIKLLSCALSNSTWL
ncbi:Uncharacterised protein [Vibrio cholerae]|nr:Uncharacterised protein [Vibrio cholerae]